MKQNTASSVQLPTHERKYFEGGKIKRNKKKKRNTHLLTDLAASQNAAPVMAHWIVAYLVTCEITA